MVGEKVQAAQFRVEPPQLGPIEVRLSITNDQANLLINAPHAVARDAIQTSLPRLQEMLLQSGLALGDVSVGTGSPDQQPNYTLRFAADHDSAALASSNPSLKLATPVRQGLGLVDLFA
jgi:flagellar hook-length control protein FliK